MYNQLQVYDNNIINHEENSLFHSSLLTHLIYIPIDLFQYIKMNLILLTVANILIFFIIIYLTTWYLLNKLGNQPSYDEDQDYEEYE